MKTEGNIFDELQYLQSEILIKPINNPYELPLGYWKTFANHLADAIQLAEANNSVQQNDRVLTPSNFDLPQDYFQSFAKNLLEKINNQSVSGFTHTLPASMSTPFAIEDNYFNTFSQSVLLKIQAPQLSLVGKAMPFEIAKAHYFENLPSNLLGVVSEREASPILDSMSKEMPFAIPNNYFEQQLSVVTTLNNSEIEGKVVDFKTRRNSLWTLGRIVAAVAILLVLGITFFNPNNNHTYQHQDIDLLSANISKEAINEYINIHIEDFALTKTEILTLAHTENTIQKYINNITTEELDEYLQLMD